MSTSLSGEQIVQHVLRTTEEINYLKDVDAILDKILYEARKLTNADAGSIFLAKEGQLTFSYVHNDTLFSKEGTEPALYQSFSIPINESSIVGYVAQSGQMLVIDDAYTLDPDLPYSFNSSYDQKTGYTTRSILTIPLKTFQNQLVGVMQIINARGPEGDVQPFDHQSQTYVPLLANNAAVAIERAVMTRELILRMMKMAELHDPSETGSHVQRVGAYSAEVYQRWALNRGESQNVIKHNKDLLRLGAMLHDVGKVGISDTILKKPARLTDDEFATMKWHTLHGARLFMEHSNELEQMCFDISLHHHEKWAGNGYPGNVDEKLDSATGTPLTGEDIPIWARIVALADVYDALSSERCYKEAWPQEKVLAVLEEESGRHFDPDVVEAFMQIYDVITAIKGKFPDTKCEDPYISNETPQKDARANIRKAGD